MAVAIASHFRLLKRMSSAQVFKTIISPRLIVININVVI